MRFTGRRPGHNDCNSVGVPASSQWSESTATNVIAVLNELIGTSEDGERGFMKAAEEAQHASVNDALLECAAHCSCGSRELQGLVLKLGGKPAGGGSVAGILHRAWLDVRSALGGRADQTILSDCEKDEDAAEKRFHDALEKDLPADVSAVVQRLYLGVAQNHDRLRLLRDQIAPTKS